MGTSAGRSFEDDRRGCRIARAAAALALVAVVIGLEPARARAQCAMASPTCTRVTPDAKGMIGLGLLGAELGFVLPALIQDAARTNEWWPYLVFPVLGAAGGVVGGYFVEQDSRNTPEVDVALLAVGVALIVPTLVTTLALTAYDPNDQQVESAPEEPEETPRYEDETTTEAVQVEGDAEQGPPAESSEGSDGATSSVRRRLERALAGGPGLLRFDGSRVLLGVPMVRRLATFTARELESMRLVPTSDVNVPLVSATF